MVPKLAARMMSFHGWSAETDAVLGEMTDKLHHQWVCGNRCRAPCPSLAIASNGPPQRCEVASGTSAQVSLNLLIYPQKASGAPNNAPGADFASSRRCAWTGGLCGEKASSEGVGGFGNGAMGVEPSPRGFAALMGRYFPEKAVRTGNSRHFYRAMGKSLPPRRVLQT